MKENVRASSFWIIIVFISTILFIYGLKTHRIYLEGIGDTTASGALVTLISETLIRTIRHKQKV